MCVQVVLENGGMLMFNPNCYKKQKMCDNAGNSYVHALRSVPDCYNTQKMCNKAVSAYRFAMQFVPDRYST